MAPREPSLADLFYEPLISTYLDASGVIPRDWLRDEIQEHLSRPSCRFVLLLGEPGAGKTGAIAALARAHPDWLRYFVRLDSTAPLSGGDAVSMMLRVGHQLAHLHPEIFDPELLEIEVKQRIEHAGADASVVGVKIEDLQVSPFYRTAIRVQQSVEALAGGLTGIEIARATVEPRLLEPGRLGHLALLDPALVLARNAPGETIVVLVDALDELMAGHGTTTVLDWLETFAEPAPNLRFVLSSRPHARLRMLESVRGSALEIIQIDAQSKPVARDVRLFSTSLFDDTQVLARAPDVDREHAITSLVRTAQGNFAYLTAYARSLRAALATGNAQQLGELLEFETLPAGLPQLYAAFARRMRRQIEGLGYIEIASPRGQGDELAPAWEGVGQRLLGVLAVAFAPLSLKQLVRLGGVRVWESAVANVLQTLMPFLNETEAGWSLFHPSLGEFLRSADRQGALDVAIDAREWHTRIVRHYQGTARWADVDWRSVDSYGLLHVAGHLAASGGDPAAVTELVTSSLRAASKERFFSDLPFRRIVETVRDGVNAAQSIGSILSDGVFLQLVLVGLSEGASQLAPAVYGLMARLGRVEEALARAQVLEPGLHKYRALEAIWRSTPADLRSQLGPLDGVEHLVGAAVEVPVTATPLVGALGFDLAACLRDAALALVPQDLDRALHLAEMADRHDRSSRASDAVRGAAATRVTPEKALVEFLASMKCNRLQPAVEAAEKANAGPAQDDLIAFAIEHLDDEELRQRVPLVARLIGLLSTESSDHAHETAARLRTTLDQLVAEESSSGFPWGIVQAAEILHDVDGELAVRVLKSCDRPEVDSLLAHILIRAARVWASWGRMEEARLRLNRALEALRALGWYGPAREIAEAAGVAAAIDPHWGEELAEEAIALVELEVQRADSYERSRLDGILAGMVDRFRDGNRERALRVARWNTGGWIHGGAWDSTDGRSGALAVLGLDAAGDNPVLAAQLLSECLAEEERDVRLGRADPRLADAGLFKPAGSINSAAPGRLQAANAIAYITNAVNYWTGGLKWRFFRTPADVLRSMDAVFPATASWARAVAAAVESVAALDLERALALTYWPADPGERLIGLAALAGALDETDPRLQTVLTVLAATLDELPQYEPEVDLGAIPQGPILLYLDPTVRARFEATLLMPAQSGPYLLLEREGQDFWFLQMVLLSENFFQALLAGELAELAADDFEQQIDAWLESYLRVDDMLKDLVRVAAIHALAPKDALRARARAERIAHPSLKVLARLLCLAFEGPDGRALPAEALQILEALNDDVLPLHRAELAATAADVCESKGQDAGRILEWGLRQLEAGDPLMITRGWIALSSVAPEAQRSAMLSRALRSSEEIGNQYLRSDAVADLLGPAVAAGDSALVASALDRLLDADWKVFVDGLRRAMPDLVTAAGPEIVEKMDLAMRRAQGVLRARVPSTEPIDHLDGVLPPPLREQALQVASDAAQWLGAYLATYLDQADVGPSLRWVQDSRLGHPDPDDDAFVRLRGRCSGLSVWLAPPDEPIWRMVDIRFLFDSASDAEAYHRERLHVNSEGKPPIPEARAVGEECHVFGGTDSLQFGSTTLSMTAFYYIFRVDQVVVKLFVAQGPEASEPLIPDHLVPLSERIVEKIRSASLGS